MPRVACVGLDLGVQRAAGMLPRPKLRAPCYPRTHVVPRDGSSVGACPRIGIVAREAGFETIFSIILMKYTRVFHPPGVAPIKQPEVAYSP